MDCMSSIANDIIVPEDVAVYLGTFRFELSWKFDIFVFAFSYFLSIGCC